MISLCSCFVVMALRVAGVCKLVLGNQCMQEEQFKTCRKNSLRHAGRTVEDMQEEQSKTCRKNSRRHA